MSAVGILRGYALGSIFTNIDGSRVLLPWADATEATLSYNGELVTSETFNDAGVLSTSRACLATEELTMSLSTSSLTWSHFQIASSTLDAASTANRLKQEIITLSDVDATPASTFTVSGTPLTTAGDLTALGLPGDGILVSDVNTGDQLTVDSVTGSDVVLDADYTGQRVLVQYGVAPGGTDLQIDIGSADNRFTNAGVYGEFFGCPGTITAILEDVAIAPSSELTVNGSDAATLGITVRAVRGDKGYLGRLIWTP